MDIQPPKHPQQPIGQSLGSEPLLSGAPNPQSTVANPADLPAQTPIATAPNEVSRRGYNFKSTLSTILLFSLAPLLAVLIAAFGMQSYQVDGQSMETTLQNRDRLIVDKVPRTLARITHHGYVPKRGNIIVFNQAGLVDASGKAEKQLIKRVIGLPGERVVVSGGNITIYNKEHPNGFDPDRTGLYAISATSTAGDIDKTLKPGEIFVCGDNRDHSEDSRFFGPVNVDQIVGKLSLRIVPLNKAQRF